MTARHDKHRDDTSRPTDGIDDGEQQDDPHARPAHEGLPFGDNPQDLQGEDPASGGS